MTSSQSPTSFGAWVRTRRRQFDLTQAGLGERAGCSEAAIRKIEADERKPSRQLAELLAQVLQIPASETEAFLQFSRGMLVDEIRLAPKTPAHNLPALLTSTIDRTQDLANITTRLKDKTVHLITLIGPPGIGKTRLSIHCGNALLDVFPDGVWFVDLADVTNADFFIPTIARFLPSLSLPPSPNLTQLLSSLRDKRLLLILDNFEQIVAGAALDVAQMLKTCPHVKILVTSRVPLHIYGENEYPLPPLSIPPRNAESGALMQFESVQLFVARTRQHQPKFDITAGNAAAVIEVCTVLDGIPLALELAAATVRQMTLDEMVTLLRSQGWVKGLASPARDLPQRQRTLENVIAWSYTLLDDRQKEIFCKLGVFNGWFDADAATALCETSAQSFLNALTEHSLLVRETLYSKPHWRMLELIHEYAASKLSSDERSYAESLRMGYFLKSMRTFKTFEEKQDAFQINFSNIHSALKWTISTQQADLGLQLVSELDDVWSSLGYFKEGLSLLRQLLNVPVDIDPARRANSLQMASDLAWQQHEFETALAYSKEGVELGRKHQLKQEYPWYLNRLGRIYIEQGKLAEAKEALNEALALAYDDPSVIAPGSPLAQLGEAMFFEGRLDEAKALLQKALKYLTPSDDIFVAIAKTDLAEIALAKGEFEKAREWLGQALPYASQQARRFIVLLSALAGYLVLSPDGSKQKAAQLYGAIESLSDHSGVVLGPFYQTLNRTRMELARKKLSAAEWQKAYETGSGWERGEAVQMANELLSRMEKGHPPL